MKVETFIRAQQINEEIKKLQELIKDVKKSPFVIEQDLDETHKATTKEFDELKYSFLPLTTHDINEQYLFNINQAIQKLNLEFKNL